MLMITFSPIAIRPSIVAEPICGSSTTLSSAQARVDRRLVIEDIETGTAGGAGFKQPDQFLFVDDLAALG